MISEPRSLTAGRLVITSDPKPMSVATHESTTAGVSV
jgi:hypothetical protein